MKSTIERRRILLELLSVRKREKIENLANELDVSVRTIRYDIEILSCTYPIFTETGPYGGISVPDDFVFGMKYLTKEQEEFLESILDDYIELERKILEEILNTFRMPKLKNERK